MDTLASKNPDGAALCVGADFQCSLIVKRWSGTPLGRGHLQRPTRRPRESNLTPEQQNIVSRGQPSGRQRLFCAPGGADTIAKPDDALIARLHREWILIRLRSDDGRPGICGRSLIVADLVFLKMITRLSAAI